MSDGLNIYYIAVTNCSAERSFSCLKRVENYLRSTMSETRLNSLAILCIESDLLECLDCEDLINQFGEKTSQTCLHLKRCIRTHNSSAIILFFH